MYSLDAGCADIRYLVMGMLSNNVYIISDGTGTFVVDPTIHADRILEALGGETLDAILLTHHHYDHIGAAYALRKATGAVVIASVLDAPYVEDQESVSRDCRKLKACPVDRKIKDGDRVKIGNMSWEVLATPGHSLGSVCFYLRPELGLYPDKAPVLLSGDTLFHGTVGRTDFEGGSADDMRSSIKKLSLLPGETIVLPGHNEVTTIASEHAWMVEYSV